MKRCMYCGHENDDAAQTCVECGNRLLDTPVEQMPPLEEEREVPEQAVPEEAGEMDGAVNASVDEADVAPKAAVEYPEDADEAALGQSVREAVGAASQEQLQPEGGYAAQANMQQYAGQAYEYGQEEAYGQNAGYGQDAGYASDSSSEYDYYQDQVSQGSPVLMEKARKLVRSPLFFLGAVMYTIYAIASVIYVVTGAAVTNVSTLANTLKFMVGDNIAIEYVGRLASFLAQHDSANPLMVRGIGTCILVPSIFLMIAIWMQFSGTTVREEKTNTSGFTFARVILILKFIVICLLLLAAVGACVAYVVAAGAANSMMTLIIGIIALLAVIIFAVLTILFYIQLLFSIRSVRTNVRTGVEIGKIPGFLIFVGILGCAVTACSMLPMAPDDYIGLIARGAGVVWLLLISIWAIVYRVIVKA